MLRSHYVCIKEENRGEKEANKANSSKQKLLLTYSTINLIGRNQSFHPLMAKCWFSISALPQMLSGKDNHWFFCNILFKPKIHLKFILIRSHIPNSIKTSIQNPTRSKKTKKEKGSGNRVLLYTCMRRFGRIR